MSISKKEMEGLVAVQTAIDVVTTFAEEVQWDGKKELETITTDLWVDEIYPYLKEEN